jgi:hypothetical protein
MKELIQKALADSRPYPEYRQFLTELLATGKTTGPNQSELYLKIADLNQSRMDRLDKKPRFIPETEALLSELKGNYTLLVLTEGWCGDAAQIVPFLNHLDEASDKLDLRLILRDEYTELMDNFLTDGGRSIPKVIVLNPDTNEVLGDWGPRPTAAQKLSMDYKYKPEPKEDYEAHHAEVHTWYARDKTKSTQAELVAFFRGLDG